MGVGRGRERGDNGTRIYVGTFFYSFRRYVEKAEQQSVIFNDRRIKPLDLAVYWTEYVIRHRRALHLKSAANQLRWYQYLLLDVILAALIIVFFTCYLFKKIVKYGCKLSATVFGVKK